MGFNLGQFISPAISAATTVAGGYESAQAQAAKEAIAQRMQDMQMKRQAEQDDIRNKLTQAQITNYAGLEENRKADNARQSEKDRIANLLSGYVPAHTELGHSVAASQVTPDQDDTAQLPVEMTTSPSTQVPEGYDKTRDRRVVQIGETAANRPAPHIDPNSPAGIQAAIDKARGSQPYRGSQGGESPDVKSSRKDYTINNTQELRTERHIADLRRDQTAALKTAPTAKDSAAVRSSFVPKIAAVQGDAEKLRARGDSILHVIPQQRGGQKVASPTDPVGVAVAHIREGTGTLAQLEASNNSAAFKAAVRQRLTP